MESPIKNIIVFSVVSLIVLLLVFFAFFKIKSRKKLPTLFLVVTFFTALFGLGGKEVLAADRACLNGQFCAQGSMTSNLVVAPSADISSNIWNVAEAQVCANGGGQTTVVYAIYDSNNNLVSTKTAVQNDGAAASHDDYNSWVDSYNSDMYWYYQYMYYADTWVDPSDDNSDPYGQRQGYIDYANHYLDLANDMLSLMNNYNQWRTFTGFNPNTANSGSAHINAPTSPGVYKLITSVYLNANYRDAGRAPGDETNGGVKTQGPISFQYNFTVASPLPAPTITSTGGPLSCGVNSYTFNWGAVPGATDHGVHVLDDTVRTAGAADCTGTGDICTGGLGTSYTTNVTSQTPSCGILAVGSYLTPGQFITSCDGRFKFILQTDGNAVIYNSSNVALWSSNTAAKPSAKIIMQGDGNLVIYNSSGGFIWGSVNSAGGHTGTPTGLNMQGDGNAVIYATNGSVLWASNSGGHGVVTLQPGHSYEARAYAYNSVGWSGGSNTIYFTVPTALACTSLSGLTPSGLTVSNLNSTCGSPIQISWTALTGATGYYMYRSSDSITYNQIATTSSVSYSDTPLIPGNYYYKIVAYNSTGSSNQTAAVSINNSTSCSCTGPDGSIIPNGSSKNYFSTTTSTLCSAIAESRVCTNKVLGGSYLNPSCTNISLPVGINSFSISPNTVTPYNPSTNPSGGKCNFSWKLSRSDASSTCAIYNGASKVYQFTPTDLTSLNQPGLYVGPQITAETNYKLICGEMITNLPDVFIGTTTEHTTCNITPSFIETNK